MKKNPAIPTLPHPDETRAVTEQLGNVKPAYQHLQLSFLADTLRALHAEADRQLAAPVFKGQTVALALAACAELESAVHAAEADARRHLSTQVGAARLKEQQVALASPHRTQ